MIFLGRNLPAAPPSTTAVDWDSPTWGANPVHVASYVDAERTEDQ